MSPQESCGVVINNTYFPCLNIADNPEEDFIMEPRDYIAARAYGEIQAYVHSHPKGGPPSALDEKACKHTKRPWHVYLIPYDKWVTIKP